MARLCMSALLLVCALFLCWTHASQFSLMGDNDYEPSSELDSAGAVPKSHLEERNVDTQHDSAMMLKDSPLDRSQASLSQVSFSCPFRSDVTCLQSYQSRLHDEVTPRLWTRAPDQDVPKSMAWLGRHRTTRNALATSILAGAAAYGWVTFRQVTHQDIVPNFLQPKAKPTVSKRDASGTMSQADVDQDMLTRRNPAQGRIRSGLFGLVMGGAMVHMHHNGILSNFADTFSPKQTKRELNDGQEDGKLYRRTPGSGKGLAYPLYAALAGTIGYGAYQKLKPTPAAGSPPEGPLPMKRAIPADEALQASPSPRVARRDGWTHPNTSMSPSKDRINVHWKSGRTSTYYKLDGKGKRLGQRLRATAKKTKGAWVRKMDRYENVKSQKHLHSQRPFEYMTSGSMSARFIGGQRGWKACMYAVVVMMVMLLFAEPARGTILPIPDDGMDVAPRSPSYTPADMKMLESTTTGVERRDGWTTVANKNAIVKISPDKDKINVHWQSGKTTTFYKSGGKSSGYSSAGPKQDERINSTGSTNASSSVRAGNKRGGWKVCSLALVTILVLLLHPTGASATEQNVESPLRKRNGWTTIANQNGVTKISPDHNKVNVHWKSGKVTTFYKQSNRTGQSGNGGQFSNNGQIGNNRQYSPTTQSQAQQMMSTSLSNASSSSNGGNKQRRWAVGTLALATTLLLLLCPTSASAVSLSNDRSDAATLPLAKRQLSTTNQLAKGWYTPEHFSAQAMISPDHSQIKIVWHSGNITIYTKQIGGGGGGGTTTKSQNQLVDSASNVSGNGSQTQSSGKQEQGQMAPASNSASMNSNGSNAYLCVTVLLTIMLLSGTVGVNATGNGQDAAKTLFPRAAGGSAISQAGNGALLPPHSSAVPYRLPSGLPTEPFHSSHHPTSLPKNYKPGKTNEKIEPGVREAFADIGKSMDAHGKKLAQPLRPSRNRRRGTGTGHVKRDIVGNEATAFVRRMFTTDSSTLLRPGLLAHRDGWTRPSQHFAVAKISPSHDRVNVIWKSGRVTRYRRITANTASTRASVPTGVRILDSPNAASSGVRACSGSVRMLSLLFAACVMMALLAGPCTATEVHGDIVTLMDGKPLTTVADAKVISQSETIVCESDSRSHGMCRGEMIRAAPNLKALRWSMVSGDDEDENLSKTLQTRADTATKRLPSLSRSPSGHSAGHSIPTSLGAPRFSAKSAAGAVLGLGLTGMMVMNMASSIQTRSKHDVEGISERQHIIKRSQNGVVPSYGNAAGPASSPYAYAPVSSVPGLKMSPLPAYYRPPDEISASAQNSGPRVSLKKSSTKPTSKSPKAPPPPPGGKDKKKKKKKRHEEAEGPSSDENGAASSRHSSIATQAFVASVGTASWLALHRHYRRDLAHHSLATTDDEQQHQSSSDLLLSKRGGKFTGVHAAIGAASALGAGALMWHGLNKDLAAKKDGYGGIKPIEDKVW